MLYRHDILYNFDKFYIVLALLPAIMFTSIIIVYICNRINKKKYKMMLILFNLIILLYQVSYFLIMVSAPAELKFLIIINNIAYCLNGALFFINIFSMIKGPLLKKYEYMALFLLPLMGIIMLITNELHQLYYTIYNTFLLEYNQVYKVMTVFNYLCLITGGILLLTYIYEHYEKPFKHIIYLIIGLIFIIVVSIYETYGPGFSIYLITPISYIIVQIILLIVTKVKNSFNSIYNFDKDMLDAIDESIIITDNQNNILYYNITDFNILAEIKKFCCIDEIFANILQNIYETTNIKELKYAVNNSISHPVNGEFILRFSNKKYYSYCVYPLKSGKKYIAGKLFVFRNITKYKLLINCLNEKNKELTVKNDMLQRHNDIIKQLIQEKERNRITTKLSNTAGDSLSRIIKMLEKECIISEDDIDECKEVIRKSIFCARKGIKIIRKSVSSLKVLKSIGGDDFNDKNSYC